MELTHQLNTALGSLVDERLVLAGIDSWAVSTCSCPHPTRAVMLRGAAVIRMAAWHADDSVR